MIKCLLSNKNFCIIEDVNKNIIHCFSYNENIAYFKNNRLYKAKDLTRTSSQHLKAFKEYIKTIQI